MLAQTLKTKEVVGLTGVNEKTLHYWDRIGLIKPSVQPGRGRGTVKLYSYADAIAVAVALRLKKAGVDGGALRQLVAFTHTRCNFKKVPERSLLVLDGRNVLQIGKSDCHKASDWGRAGYAVGVDLSEIVDQFESGLRTYKEEA